MDTNNIIKKFKKYIHKNFFEIKTDVKKLILTESNGANYQVQLNVGRPINNFLIIHNLEELKQNYAKYLKQFPKDCDYIIVDLYKHNILFIELKDTSSYTNISVMEQLNAGEKWLEHLLFCSESIQQFKDYSTYKILVKYSQARPSRSRRVNQSGRGDLQSLKDVMGEKLITFRGNQINIDAFVN